MTPRPTSAAGRVVPVAAAVATVATSCGRNPSTLDPKGPNAGEVAWLFWLMSGLGTAVLILVTALLLGTARRRRPSQGGTGGDGDPGRRSERRSLTWIVAGGVVLPVLVVVPLSVLTLLSLNRLEAAPDDDALEVEVEGNQFWWEVRYPGTSAITANEVHIPVGRDVRFLLSSADVIHSFWVPNLAGKRDLIPGEDTELVFRADEVGLYEGFCAEFCGLQHAWMRLRVIAEEPEAFDAWLQAQASDAAEPQTPAEQRGLDTFLEVGCASCHQVRGTPANGRVGPDLTHFADRRSLGAVVAENNRGNLGGWIANPHGLKPGTTMPPTPLTGQQLTDLIAYVSSLR